MKLKFWFMVVLESIFVLTSVFFLFKPSSHAETPFVMTCAAIWAVSGVLLLVFSIMNRKAMPRVAVLAWLTLFVALVIGVITPRLG